MGELNCIKFQSSTYRSKVMDIIHVDNGRGQPCRNVWLVYDVLLNGRTLKVVALRDDYSESGSYSLCNISIGSSWHLACETPPETPQGSSKA